MVCLNVDTDQMEKIIREFIKSSSEILGIKKSSDLWAKVDSKVSSVNLKCTNIKVQSLVYTV